MAASAQAASNAHAEEHQASGSNTQQADAAAQIGHGTPASRPKKRLPSGKGKKAQSGSEMPQQPDQIPPVPQIPDMHRAGSPNTHTPTMMSLQSPYGHVPPEHYGHQGHLASPTSAGFYHTASPGGPGSGHHAPPPGDYGGYYGSHPGYMMHQQHQGQPQMQYGDSRQRMMMEGGRNLGMGYVGPGGHNEGNV